MPAYFYDIDEPPGRTSRVGKQLDFQYGAETVKRAVTLKFPGQEVPGASHDFIQWAGGGRRSWQVQLIFDGDEVENGDESWVKDRVHWIESLTLPEFDENRHLVAGPHRVLWTFGEFFSRVVRVVGFNAEFTRFHPEPSLLPLSATVDLVLAETVTSSWDYRELRR